MAAKTRDSWCISSYSFILHLLTEIQSLPAIKSALRKGQWAAVTKLLVPATPHGMLSILHMYDLGLLCLSTFPASSVQEHRSDRGCVDRQVIGVMFPWGQLVSQAHWGDTLSLTCRGNRKARPSYSSWQTHASAVLPSIHSTEKGTNEQRGSCVGLLRQKQASSEDSCSNAGLEGSRT